MIASISLFVNRPFCDGMIGGKPFTRSFSGSRRVCLMNASSTTISTSFPSRVTVSFFPNIPLKAGPIFAVPSREWHAMQPFTSISLAASVPTCPFFFAILTPAISFVFPFLASR